VHLCNIDEFIASDHCIPIEIDNVPFETFAVPVAPSINATR
jgi:hypothetical protein